MPPFATFNLEGWHVPATELLQQRLRNSQVCRYCDLCHILKIDTYPIAAQPHTHSQQFDSSSECPSFAAGVAFVASEKRLCDSVRHGG